MPTLTDPIDELFIAVDVEAAGPIPPTYSLLSLGACVVTDPSRSFYAELAPINENAVPEALRVSGLSLQHLKDHGEEPGSAMRRFAGWVTDVSDARRVVFVGFNACFDWAFVNWYLLTFVGDNPFGFSGLDIKAYYMGLSGCRWCDTTSSRIPAHYQPAVAPCKSHNALMDAMQQAEIFYKLLRASRGDRLSS